MKNILSMLLMKSFVNILTSNISKILSGSTVRIKDIVKHHHNDKHKKHKSKIDTKVLKTDSLVLIEKDVNPIILDVK